MVITNEQLEKQFRDIAEIEYVKATGDGYHYQLIVVSDLFVGKSKVARQQWVYGVLNKHILSGELHAIQMQTMTKSEWETQHG
ncbi:MAG: BolA family transcriptional regulator [Legionellales bacterium RIFCSPHIGHO2_12_FULL_35_11]|nr:MAG: BolA family transcriptional regulator [Legionellales bacterium RIFCSPHIGHO2_12_FULL_35_11]